jgi:hypothetical protein
MTGQLEKFRPTGVIRDLSPPDVPPESFTSSQNMIYREGFAERIVGVKSVFGAPLGPPIFLIAVTTQDAAYWVYATDDGAGNELLAATDGTIHFDITPVGGISTPPALLQSWTASILNGIPVFSNGAGDLWFWDLDPGNPAQTVPDWEPNSTTNAIRTFGNYLIAIGITAGSGTEFPFEVRWSASAAPGSIPAEWTPLATNDAGDLSVAETPGPLIDGLALRNQFMLYKSNSTHTMDFIGGTFVFALRTLFTTSGVLSRNCVVEFNGNHLMLTNGDVVVTDGNSVSSVIDRRMRRFLFSSMDSDNFGNSFVVKFRRQNEIWICYPEQGNEFPNRAIVWDYANNLFGERDLFETPSAAAGVVIEESGAGLGSWDAQTENWNQMVAPWSGGGVEGIDAGLVLADRQSLFYAVDVIGSNDGVPINASVNRDSLDFGAPEIIKTVVRIWPHVTGNIDAPLLMRVGSQMNSDAPIQWGTFLPFNIGTSVKVDAFATGRYISVQVSSVGGIPWQLTGFDIEYNARGPF